MNIYEEDGLYDLACSLIGREISALASQIHCLEKSTIADPADIATLAKYTQPLEKVKLALTGVKALKNDHFREAKLRIPAKQGYLRVKLSQYPCSKRLCD